MINHQSFKNVFLRTKPTNSFHFNTWLRVQVLKQPGMRPFPLFRLNFLLKRNEKWWSDCAWTNPPCEQRWDVNLISVHPQWHLHNQLRFHCHHSKQSFEKPNTFMKDDNSNPVFLYANCFWLSSQLRRFLCIKSSWQQKSQVIKTPEWL